MPGLTGEAPERRMSAVRDDALRLLRQRVYGFALQKGCRPAEAEDVAQDTLAVVLNKYSAKAAEDLIKIATIICLNLVRNKRRLRSRVDAELVEYISDPRHGPEDLMLESEVVEALLDAIEKSRPADKALLRAALQGHSVETICALFNIDANTFYSRRHRCYKRMRSVLAKFR